MAGAKAYTKRRHNDKARGSEKQENSPPFSSAECRRSGQSTFDSCVMRARSLHHHCSPVSSPPPLHHSLSSPHTSRLPHFHLFYMWKRKSLWPCVMRTPRVVGPPSHRVSVARLTELAVTQTPHKQRGDRVEGQTHKRRDNKGRGEPSERARSCRNLKARQGKYVYVYRWRRQTASGPVSRACLF